MSVTQHYMNPGSFEIPLLPTAPRGLLRQIKEFGHIYIYSQHLGQLDIFSDQVLMDGARYAGIVMEPEFGIDDFSINGLGVEAWLGDEDLGPIIEATQTFANDNATTVINAILPDAIAAGTITETDVPLYTGTHVYENPIAILRTYSLATEGHWRVNPNCTLDFCATSQDDVFITNEPKVISVRKGWGHDADLVSVPARDLTTRRIAYDYANRVIAVSGSEGSYTLEASESRASDGYYDVHGNPIVRTKRVSSPGSTGSVSEFLTGELESLIVIDEQEVSTEQFEFHRGNLAVGDMFYIFDPPSGFVDYDNEVFFRGQVIWPKKERLIEATWPVAQGMGVYYRPPDQTVEATDWIDLTRYVDFES